MRLRAQEGDSGEGDESRVEAMMRVEVAEGARGSARAGTSGCSGAEGGTSRSARRRYVLDRLLQPEPLVPPAVRAEFVSCLLSDFDDAWRELARSADVGDAAHARLLELRNAAERAAEFSPYPCAGLRASIRLCAVTLFIEADAAVPESQVDCALSLAAEAASVAMARPSPHLFWFPAFFRYQDLMAMPLAAVHSALVSAACDGNPVTVLRRMPLQAHPAAARCSPNYLRFVVGVSVAEDGAGSRPDGLRWAALEEIARSVLGVRLRVPVNVVALCWGGLCGPAHHGLRTHQAARLLRIVAGLGSPQGLAAHIELHEAAGVQRRARLMLTRDRSCAAACMLQLPWDESPAQLLARVSCCLRAQGISCVELPNTHSARHASRRSVLAEPI